jgi:hypothetical protein
VVRAGLNSVIGTVGGLAAQVVTAWQEGQLEVAG